LDPEDAYTFEELYLEAKERMRSLNYDLRSGEKHGRGGGTNWVLKCKSHWDAYWTWDKDYRKFYVDKALSTEMMDAVVAAKVRRSAYADLGSADSCNPFRFSNYIDSSAKTHSCSVLWHLCMCAYVLCIDIWCPATGQESRTSIREQAWSY
jgi:hypothetical protein